MGALPEQQAPGMPEVVAPAGNPNGRDELGRFEPGVSGNPGGRPGGRPSVVKALERRLKAHPEELESIVENLVRIAASGAGRDAVAAAKWVADRLDGPVSARLELGVDPVKVVVGIDLGLLERGATTAELVERGISDPQDADVRRRLRAEGRADLLPEGSTAEEDAAEAD